MYRKNAKIKVHLRGMGKMRRDLMWQESAPVYSVSYNSPYSRVIIMFALTLNLNYNFLFIM